MAIKKTIIDIRKYHVARKVAETLNKRNRPNTSYLIELLLNSEILVYKERQGWDPKLYRLIGRDGQTC
jgi:hypothetical protein